MAERTMTITQTQQQSTSEGTQIHSDPLPDAQPDSTTLTLDRNPTDCSPILHLRLKKPKSRKKVKWTNDTVDNETMGKKKSKCCCVYEKPRVFGESSSEDDSDECDSCRGHKPNCYKQDDSEGKTSHGPSGSEGGGGHDPADDNPHSPSGSDANEGGAVGGTFI